MVKLLLDEGADLTLLNDGDETPLSVACCNDHLETVRLLLDRGADPNSPQYGNSTLLDGACWAGYSEIAELLLHRGADYSLGLNHGTIPLHHA